MLNYVEYGKENKYDDDIFFQKYSKGDYENNVCLESRVRFAHTTPPSLNIIPLYYKSKNVLCQLNICKHLVYTL